jgi:hypothetical protein
MTCLLTSSWDLTSFYTKALACIGLGSWRMLVLFESLVAKFIHGRSARHCCAQSFLFHPMQWADPCQLGMQLLRSRFFRLASDISASAFPAVTAASRTVFWASRAVVRRCSCLSCLLTPWACLSKTSGACLGLLMITVFLF